LPVAPKKLSKKAIIAIFFIALFTLSLAVVFLYPQPDPDTTEGYVNVSRSEGYWENKLVDKTDARYLVNYGIYAVSDTPKVTITDKTELNLTQIELEQETTNVKVSYDKATGAITVIATDLKADDKIFAQLAFVTEPVDIFATGENPVTIVTPDKVYWGEKTSISIEISPFRIERNVNVTEVGIYAWLTDAVGEISDASSNPPAKMDPPTYQAIWNDLYPESNVFTSHVANYTIRLPVTSQTGNVLLRTWVEVRYSTPLRMTGEGTITGADGYFFKVDSSVSYQYEHSVSSSVTG
jgi:hypothetical protein